MACQGCMERRRALAQMLQAVKLRDMARAKERVRFVGASAMRDIKKIGFSSVKRTQRKP